jgi:class 3 adenylate cyclase
MWSAAMDVGGWLRSLGLDQYGERFRDNKIDANVLPQLTADDLKKVGVAAVGDGSRLLAAIAALAESTLSTSANGIEIRAKPALSEPSDASAERRQLIVIFCDFIGSTAMSARLDPEDMRAVIAAYQKCCSTLILGNGGRAVSSVSMARLALTRGSESR